MLGAVMEAVGRAVGIRRHRGEGEGETGHEYVTYRGYRILTVRNANSGWYRYRIYGKAPRRGPTNKYTELLATGGPYNGRGEALAAGKRYVREHL